MHGLTEQAPRGASVGVGVHTTAAGPSANIATRSAHDVEASAGAQVCVGVGGGA